MRKSGFRNVEFQLGHVKEFLNRGHSVEKARRLLEAHELTCIGGFECALEAFSPPEQRAENHERLRRNAELLAELGAITMVVGSDGPLAPMAKPLEELAGAFCDVEQSISDTGITICLEFNWSPLVKSLRTAVEVARLMRLLASRRFIRSGALSLHAVKIRSNQRAKRAVYQARSCKRYGRQAGRIIELQQRPCFAGTRLSRFKNALRRTGKTGL